MIDLKKFNDKSVTEIFNEARQRIDFLNSNWTYTQLSDPGITVLELLSWLKHSQHDYLNNISGKTKIKLLKLLGINLKKCRGSKTFLKIKNSVSDFLIPRNTKWKSKNLVFENQEAQFISKSDILSISFNNPEFFQEKKHYSFTRSEKIFIFGNDNLKSGEIREFTISLSNEIPKDKFINLYFNIFNINKRNEIIDGSFIPLANIKWQYFGEKNGKSGWFDFDFFDSTNAFLFSGIVSLKHDSKMILSNGLFHIKCKLISSEYDFMPQLSGIDLNVFEVVQKDTKCDNYFVSNEDINSDDNFLTFNVYNHLCLYGQNLVYYGFDDSWINIKRFQAFKDVENGFCSFKIEKSEIENLDINKIKFLVVSFSNDLENRTIIGNGMGYSNLFFETNFKDLSLYDDFQIMVGEKYKDNFKFKIWKRVDDFFQSSKFDNHFVYEENAKIIAFGDNQSGAIPPKGTDNIRFCKLSFTQGEDSNLRENMINDVESENEVLKNSNILQINPATGGRDDESLDEAQKRVSKIFEDEPRAVLVEDYINLVKKTPGLIIKDVSVSISDNKLENKVLIALRIPGKKTISNLYKRNILNWVDRFRLINTKIELLNPLVVFLDIKVKVIVDSNSRLNDDIIKKCIVDFIDKLNEKMGQNLIYGNILKKLQSLECVYYLESLEIGSSLEYSNNNSLYDNIMVPMNAIYELRSLDINSIINTNI